MWGVGVRRWRVQAFMVEWLADNLIAAADQIPERAEGFCLGRGIPSSLLEEMRVGMWVCPDQECPDSTFTERYGSVGQRVAGWISIPMWSPRGKVIGVEYRRWEGAKGVQKFFLPDSRWVPVFTGMTPSVLSRIWKGGDIWLVEGVFDLAVGHAIPSKDVVLACGGAKTTPGQLTFLKRFLSDGSWVHVCFDMDETGQNMAQGYTHPKTGKRIWGVVERLTRAGVKARGVQYRGGKDPGEIWEKSGTTALRRVLHL